MTWRQAAYVRSAIDVYKKLKFIGAIDISQFSKSLAINFGRIFIEILGFLSIVPLIQFLESGKLVDRVGSDQFYWDYIKAVYLFFDIEITVFSLSLPIFILITCRQVVSFYSIISLEKLKEITTKNVRDIFFVSLNHGNADFFGETKKGDLLSSLITQSLSVGSILRSVISLSALFLTLVIYSTLLALVSPVIVLTVLTLGTAIAISLNFITKLIKINGQQIVAETQVYSNFLVDRLAAWKEIKLFRMLESQLVEHNRISSKLFILNLKRTSISGLMGLIFVPCTMAALLLFVNFNEFFGFTSLGDVIMACIICLRLYPSIQAFLASKNSFSGLLASLDYIYEVSRIALDKKELSVGKHQFPREFSNLRFDRVNLIVTNAHTSQSIINDANFIIRAGKITSIIGPSGAGKTSLVDLISRIRDPSTGSIYLDDKNISDFELDCWRANLSVISQDPILFDLSIRDNICCGKFDITQEHVEAAAKFANATKFINRLPNGFDTRIGDGGRSLSGGQKQKISIARAFIQKSKIIILDEPSSALDYESENQLKRSLLQINKKLKSTVILVGHKNSLVSFSDDLIFVQDGKIEYLGNIENGIKEKKWIKSFFAEE
ncbi:ABC transporter ATP-binding protein/permease [Alphaproteobacteria bacterium]|nr:ABC transporter ATP-binding protein/permease [Alphaproteobacteria bacterium]